jgi:hypothetical protein
MRRIRKIPMKPQTARAHGTLRSWPDFSDISNNVCGVKVFLSAMRRELRGVCFDCVLVEELLIIDDEGSHVIYRGGTRSDPNISPIARSTTITTSNSRELGAGYPIKWAVIYCTPCPKAGFPACEPNFKCC